MLIGIDSSAYRDASDLSAGYSRARRHGYGAIDYQELVNTETPLYAMDQAAFLQALKDEAAIIRDAGLVISQTHGPWRYPPMDGDVEHRAERFEKMARAIAGTRALGCDYMVIHPLMPFGTGGDGDREAYFDINRRHFTGLLKIARDEGVTICLENMPMPDLPLGKTGDVLSFVEELSGPNFRICLDTGHCAVCGESPAQAVRAIGREYLAALHVHDNDGRRDLHMLPWRGVIDWADFRAALHEIGFDGALSLETHIPSKLPDPLREYEEIGLAMAAKILAE